LVIRKISLLGEVSLSSAALETLRMRINMHHLQEMRLTGKNLKLIFPIPELYFRFSEMSLIYFKQEFQVSFCYHFKTT
jgi:hypothetical protein